ncbi:MerR family transcriptional regulator [Lactobacillus sp. LC28-10]|uniref:MerR family transcriptional regulator n=1 Tax=Secundilactobacillus angelensis TaxID=2722706 RepID=A0ABX1KYP3_9LACO|nr:MerR family transcriptional regulator [Secundilactobacillus angelensis]MCH5462323.1 MerR family transcriptional regulator [Secundilactobacillus angelensis]NLR19062.1 MerR family transcriptional regulator [Secundilactobacillus angelensis]
MNYQIPNLVNTDTFVFRIGELSRMTGVSSRQLRYWEQREYISANTRDDQNKARVYDFHTFLQVSIIKKLQDEGYRLPAAVEKMRSIEKEILLARKFFKVAFNGVEVVEGKMYLNLGYFDKAKTQVLYGLYENGEASYEVRPANDNSN